METELLGIYRLISDTHIGANVPGNLLMGEFIERRSQGGDRRTQQRRSHADDQRSSGRNYQVPRRLRGERRQREGRRATD